MTADTGLARPLRFADTAGTPLPLLCRVAQIALDPLGGAVAARLPQQGQVVGWDTTWLPVCVDQDRALVVLRPHLVCALDPFGGP
ncbi:MAG: hypothetical protein JO115_09980 [Pseudonocardiales bacterium]|nr:hypothetical protein [Pseudonocardiales bacterium]